MDRNEVMRLAREAGFVDYEIEDYTVSGYDVRFERFAEQVAASEREECAKVCDILRYTLLSQGRVAQEEAMLVAAAMDCAAAIRARGKQGNV